MDKEEFKELIKDYLKENMTVDIVDSTQFGSYTKSVRVLISVEDEEITSSEVFIAYPEPRLRFD